MDMLRVWPIVCQFGVGGMLVALGIWAGLKGGYLNLRRAEGQRLLAALIGGYLFLLIVSCLFTFIAPNWGSGGAL